MSDRTYDQILTLLQKIEALKERGATKAEQEAAAAALTRLMTKYNLSSEEFRLRTDLLSVKTDPKQGFVNELFILPARGTWRGNLLSILCCANFCRALFYSDGRRTAIIGAPRNVQIVKRLYQYLEADIESLSHRAYTIHRVFGSTLPAKSWKTSFKLGCVHGLQDAMEEAKRQSIEETPNGSALAVLLDQELQDAVDAFFPKQGKPRNQTRTAHIEAYGAGVSVGKTLNTRERLPTV